MKSLLFFIFPHLLSLEKENKQLKKELKLIKEKIDYLNSRTVAHDKRLEYLDFKYLEFKHFEDDCIEELIKGKV